MKPEEMWSKFCSQNNIDPNTNYEAWQFGGAPDNLAALVVLGIKYATASLYDLYALDDEEPMPQEGDYSIILNSKDEAVCVIQTTKLEVIPFDEVDEKQAVGEGEGDKSLAYWRRVHDKFFKEQVEEYGGEFNEKSRILCETFKLCYSEYTVDKLENKCGQEYYAVRCEGELCGHYYIENKPDCFELSLDINPDMCGQGREEWIKQLALATIEDMDSTKPIKMERALEK